jgi:ATP-dependent DNA helicase RecG
MARTIPRQESLTIEFKSDRTRLSDRELIETVVCFANTEGGEIYLGVEDNDYSSLPIAGATVADFDPLERERLRQLIERYGGERTLLSLNDEDMDGALGFVRTRDGHRVPTITGLLILGREAALREHIPTHEVAFQVLEGTQVRVNDFYRTPMLKLFERVMQQFEVRVEEDELQIGLFRVPVPNYDKRAFREAFVNALIHRDYTRLGAVHVRWEDYGIVISNPGGFIEGVSLDNLLVVEPRPRNPFLADAIKRIGLAARLQLQLSFLSM